MQRMKFIYLVSAPDNHELGYDTARAFVVCAQSTKDARLIAGQNAGDETSVYWLCERVTVKNIGRAHQSSPCGLILRDYLNG